MMIETGIVKRTQINGIVSFFIQKKKNSWFNWSWVDASLDRADEFGKDGFESLSDAKLYLHLFDGTTDKDEVVYVKND